MLQKYLNDTKRGLYCFDWEKLEKDLEIWGSTSYNDFQQFELILSPCNYVHSHLGWTGDSVANECIDD